DYISGSFKQAENGYQRFVTTRVPPDIAKELAQYDVKFSGSVESNWLATILSWVLPTLLFFGVWYFVFRRFANQQGRRRLHVGRTQQGQGLCRDRHQGHLRRRGGRRRGKGRAQRSRRFPQNPKGVWPPRRAPAQGHIARRPAWHGEDFAGARRRRRGGG